MQSNVTTPVISIENGQEQITSPILVFLAKLVSYILHPIFVPIYVIAFLLFLHPTMFTGFSEAQKTNTLIISAINLVGFPLLSILLLRALGFIQSIYLKTQRDRIIPYIACGIFFFWAYTVFKNQTQYPIALTSFVLGVFLASSAALMANIYMKVSMHTIGIGGWLGFTLLLFFTGNLTMPWVLASVMIIAGLVGTARLLLNHHRPIEIYVGYLIGILAQVVAWYFLH